jgi:hypothetical protein
VARALLAVLDQPPPPPALAALLDAVAAGHGLDLYTAL